MNTSNDPLAVLNEVVPAYGSRCTHGDIDSAQHAITALVAAARELILAAPAFRSRPLGSKGSDARILQDQHIAAEDALRAALANFPESKA